MPYAELMPSGQLSFIMPSDGTGRLEGSSLGARGQSNRWSRSAGRHGPFKLTLASGISWDTDDGSSGCKVENAQVMVCDAAAPAEVSIFTQDGDFRDAKCSHVNGCRAVRIGGESAGHGIWITDNTRLDQELHNRVVRHTTSLTRAPSSTLQAGATNSGPTIVGCDVSEFSPLRDECTLE